MRLPKLHTILAEGRESFVRFSFPILVAALGTAAAVLLMTRDPSPGPVVNVLQKLLLTALLGVPLLTSFTIAAERRTWKPARKMLLLLCGAALLVLYYVLLPADVTVAPTMYLIRTTVFAVALHLLVSFSPFTGRGEISAFWEFNKVLFLRLLIAALYTFVLWLGLSIALLAIHELFNVDIPGERYGQLFALLAGLFNTWFFLAGVPSDTAALDADRAYPKGLKLFVQFVLIPLVTIYLIILYAYSIKILVDWDWPKGWVSYLVIGFSMSGIFATLLVHPIARREGNRFLYLFTRGYFAALLPMTALLFLAIWRRIAEYGITERRYYVLALAIWLTGIILYFLASKAKSIKMIPLSLCVSALLTTFGPWGTQSVAARSQLGRLEALLAKNGILVDGKIAPAQRAVPFADARRISSILRHFTEVNGAEPLKIWVAIDVDTLGVRRVGGRGYRDSPQAARQLAQAMHVRYVDEWEGPSASERTLNAWVDAALDVQGFEQIARLGWVGYAGVPRTFQAGEEQWTASFDKNTQELSVRWPGSSSGQAGTAAPDSVRFALTPFVRQLLQDESVMVSPEKIPPGRLTLGATAGTRKLRLVFTTLRCDMRGDSASFLAGSCDLLIGRTGQ